MESSVCSSTRRLQFVLQALLLIVLAGAPRLAGAQSTVTLDAPGSEVNADTTIRDGGYASVNYSQSDSLESKVSSRSYNRRIFLKFDTQNYVPAGAVINSAKLYLTLKEADSSSSRPFAAYRVTRSFAAPETTWYDYKADSRWSYAGGDLGEKYSTTYVSNAVGSTYVFDLTQLVQRTVRGDFGSRYTRVALLDVGGAASDSYRRFHSSRSTNTALRPKLVITYGSTNTSDAVTPTSGTSLRVVQWNVHKTTGTDGKCNADRTASWMVKLAPQVISVNEVSYYSGTCSYTADQGATLEALLEQKTGQAWYRKFVNANGKVGNLILSRMPFASSSTHLLSYGRGVVQVGVVVNGRTVNVFSTHVDYYNSSYRTKQINEAKSWISTFAEPRIVMGDFNTNPGSSDYTLMAGAFYDAWMQAKQSGTASAYNGTGATHGSSRFDYVWNKGSVFALKSVTVPDTSSSGVYPSDHDPVVAVFEVK
jgi:endonuclease/exonuclease/phosphatase family metal-dependent hydrolase